MGADGTRVRALTVCHEDTSTWSPDAPSFHVLNVKSGTLPICHFLPNGHFGYETYLHKSNFNMFDFLSFTISSLQHRLLLTPLCWLAVSVI